MTQMRTVPGGTFKLDRYVITNDNDMTYAVPTGKLWDMDYVIYELNASGDAGNRVLRVIITDGTNIIWMSTPTGNIAATQKGAIWVYFKGSAGNSTGAKATLSNGTTALNQIMADSAPNMILPAGYQVRVLDTANIAGAADDGFVIIKYIEYDA